MPVEPIGLGLVLGGILLSFKGAVDGYKLLAGIFASDNRLRFASSRYYVKSLKLELWGEPFAVSDGPACLLLKVPQIIQGAVARILAEVKHTHLQTIIFLSKYEMRETSVLLSEKVEEALKQKEKLKWALKDREAFSELIDRLETLNRNLWEFVGNDPRSETRIVTGVLEGLSKPFDLEMQEQDPSTAAASVRKLSASLLDLQYEADVRSGRCLGFYTKDQTMERVWIEWKSVSKSNPAKDQIVTRIYALGALLASTNIEAFQQLTCLGIFDEGNFEEHTKGSCRIAFVYQLQDHVDQLPTSFFSILQEARRYPRPPLGDRFTMAYKLASALSIFHATNWVHMSFRSDNVSFATRFSITNLRISGLQYSHPAAGTSMESHRIGNPELDLYYHPEISGGWSKLKDIYSLGVVLIEIAFWRPVFEERFRTMGPVQVSEAILGDLNGKFGADLTGMVGETFVDVIKCCLTGSFGVKNSDSGIESKVLSNMFSLKVVKALESCKA